MSENAVPNQKPLIWMSALGLVVMATLAYFLMHPQGRLVTDLYQYYPKNTAFYLELAPGNNLASRFVRGVDRLQSIRHGGSGQSRMPFNAIFKKDFEPDISMGMWVPESKGDAAGRSSILMVLTLKPGVTPESMARDLHATPDDYLITKEGDATILESKAGKHPPIAFHKNHLLTAPSTESLKQALAEWKTPETLKDNPFYKDNLGHLPDQRQGTLLFLSQEFQKFPQAQQQSSGLKSLADIQSQMTAATPVTVCSIVIDQNQLIKLDSFTPIDLAKITDVPLRKDLKTLYKTKTAYNLADLLPKETVIYGGMSGLGSYYDLYINHLANAQGRQTVENIQTQLKMIGLDLRKNLVSLLDGTAGVGIVSKDEQPDVLVFLNGNTDTRKTMEQLSAMATQMLRGQLSEQQVDGQHALKVLEVPGLPFKAAYSDVKAGTLVLGTQAGLENMYSVTQKKAPSIRENTLYKELTAGIPDKTNGVFFIDVQQGGVLLDQMAAKSPYSARMRQQPSLQKMLSGVEGIAGSNTVEGEKLIRGHLSVKLASDNTSAVEH